MRYDKKVGLKNYTEELEKIYEQRRLWLFASSIVFVSIILGIAGWDYLETYASRKVWWAIISIGLILSVNWWYWTMRSIAILVRNMYAEYNMLHDIINEITELKAVMQLVQYDNKKDYNKRRNCNE